MINKLNNIKIKGIEIYYPASTQDVDEIIAKHKEKGEDIEIDIKSFFGRKILRTCKDSNENSLTMAIEASKKVLESTGLNGSDIDMIVFSSTTPEYFSPPTSVFIHNAIKGKSAAICYDMNANCIGMTFSFVQICQQMQADPNLERVLLVGSDAITGHVQQSKGLMDACLGDSACAIILEKTSSEDCGLISNKYYMNPEKSIHEVTFPECGFSNVYEADVESRRLRFLPPDPEISIVPDYINNILSEQNLKVSDISMFCLSQFALYYVEYLKQILSIEDDKCMYIADKFGYTGTTSPFLVLYYALKENKVKRGDYVLLWTIGIGTQHVFALIKY